jgi:tetratricopeptide (TPR) repeat protein
MARYQVSHSVADLEHAIGLYEETLRLRPAGHERQAEALNDLGVAFYYFCFHHQANEARASHSIELLREALRLRPSGHPWRHRSLHDLARALRILGYPQQGSIATIVECESLTREALQLRTPGHPERVNSLGSLASCLQLIFEHTGDIAILAKMVSMYRETVQSCPPGHAMRWVALNTLGCSLRQSFEILGGSETLAEAISVTREAKQLCPITDLERYMVLTNLSASLAFRTLYEGHPYSLPEAIDLSREALQLVPDNQPARSTLMNNLGEALKYSFRHHGDDNALTEAIICLRQAVILPAPLLGDKGGIDALQGLAEALELRFDKDKDTDSLLEAANIYRDILRSQPTDYRRHISLEGLGRILCRIGGEAWPEALSCYTEALHVCPMGSPDRAQLLSGMSKCFLEPTSQSFNFLEGITYLSKAYADSISPVSRRLRLAIVDLQQLEAAYMTTMNRIHTKSRTHDDERVLSLYTQVMSLLPLAANFGLDHGARLQALTGCDEICRNAVARAMLLGEVSQAVQMLEQGRGVFWTQALHLRGTAFDGVPDDDCQELQRLLRLFEHGAHRMDSLRQSVAQHERELERRRQLNESVQALILKIRGYPGLDRFLLPPAFDSLLSALPEGFFVVVNVSQLGHHALLLHRTRGLATGLELKSFRAGFDCATLRTRLPREGAIHARAIRIDKGTVNEFDEVLSVLWTSIVHPVVQALGLHVSRGSLSHALCLILLSPGFSRTCSAATVVVCDGRTRVSANPCGWEILWREHGLRRGLHRLVVYPHDRFAHEGKT